MLKVAAKFKDSSVAYRIGTAMFRIPRLGDATQEQLKELEKRKHPGVIKEAKTASKKKGVSSS